MGLDHCRVAKHFLGTASADSPFTVAKTASLISQLFGVFCHKKSGIDLEGERVLTYNVSGLFNK